MELGLTGKLAIICAGSKGLGRACALELAREGVHIGLCGRDTSAIEDTCNSIAEINGDGALGVVADVSLPADIDAFIDETEQGFGQSIDIVIWNGGGPPPGSLLTLPPDVLRAGLAQHMEAPLHLFKRTLPGMRSRGFGRIIAITSIAAKQPMQAIGVSTASRAGLHGILKSLASEVASDGVTVNAVLPSNILTDRLRALANSQATEDMSEDAVLALMAGANPSNRLGSPAEFAAAVAFLASERASYITGVSLAVDGGDCRALF